MGKHHQAKSLRRLRKRYQGFHFEGLEARQFLSGNPAHLAPMTPTWTINGTDANDVIAVAYNGATQKFDLTINGVLIESRPAPKVRKLVINGRNGNDTITLNTGGKILPTVINGGAGNDTITGGDGNETINGGDGNDTIEGGAGNDTIHGNAGDDTLRGGTGNDALFGDAGDDSLDGGEGNDRLTGGTGNDVLIGGVGKDALNGGAGIDTNYAVKGTDSFVKDKHDAVIASEQPISSVAETTPGGSGGNTTPPGAQISPELRQRLIEEAVARYKTLFGTTYTQYPWYYLADTITFRSTAILGAVSANGSIGTPDHSDTNTQEQGVDEADLVETDGNFIYTVRGDLLVVIDVRDPANAHISDTIALAGQAVGLYLVGGRLAVLTGWYQTTVSIFDVGDPTLPVLVEKTAFSGLLISSRVVGHQLYLVMANDLRLPPPRATQLPLPEGDKHILANSPSYISLRGPWNGTATQYQYETEAEYRQWISDHLDDYLPTYSTTLGDGTTGPAGSLLGNIQNDLGPLGQIVSLVDIDITDDTPGPAAVVTASGTAHTVYASEQNLYLFGQRADGGTSIMKFNLGIHAVEFAATGYVAGVPLNSNAIDEYNGQLRVVTESWSPGLTHTLVVLSQVGNELTVTGSLANIGNNESLRSVLFVEDRAFVVTFRRVDPLFAIDLSDPANPVSRGELVMPGFSSYLFPIDRNHLIGVGQAGAVFGAVQISLYNVEDLTHPTLVDQEIFDTSALSGYGFVSSAAQYDPHAFSYFPEQGVVAIPLNGWNGSTGNQDSLAVLKVDPAHGFADLGRVAHTTYTQRSLRIGENLYSLAQGDLKIVDLLDPSHLIADVILPVPPPLVFQLPIDLIQIRPPIFSPIILQPIFSPIISAPGMVVAF